LEGRVVVAHQDLLSDGTPSRPSAAAAPAVVLTPPQKQLKPLQHGAQQVQARYVSYTIQKQSSSRGNHALFWLQDEQGGHTLAVVVSEGMGGCVGEGNNQALPRMCIG